jgi:hypothetical protein
LDGLWKRALPKMPSRMGPLVAISEMWKFRVFDEVLKILRMLFNGREKPLMRIGRVLEFGVGLRRLWIRLSCNQQSEDGI